jgi:MFS family permease
MWIVYHGREMFIFFLFPIAGLVLDAILDTRKLIYILAVAGLFVSPAVTGYSYTFSWGYGLFFFLALSSGYSLISKEIGDQKGKIWLAVFSSGALFLVLGLFFFIASFSGSQTVEGEWQTEDYKIEYIRDQGFAGGPLMKYELSKYSQIPFFIKKIETRVDSDTTENCELIFEESKILFDKCDGDIKEIE